MPKIVEDEQIYRAVMQVVAERGYSGATTKQMADAADVSEVTIFRKYGSKQELVKQAISSIINHTDLASAAQYTGDINADLTRVVQAYQDSAVKHGDFVSALFLEMSRHPELVDTIDEPLNIFLAIGELIACYQDDGQLKKGHPMHTVAVLLGPLMYTAMMRRAIPIAQLPQLDLSIYVKDFLNGYQTDPFRE
jgi:AcrR family transcriptional regulator